MKNGKYALIMGVSLFLFSCGNDVKTEETDVKEPQEEHVHDSESIELDKGEKWVVVDEMMGYIKTMENHVNQFESLEEQDYYLLAKKLEDNLNLLTSNCTMTGQAHDELHKWLLPYIDMVGELANAETKEDEVVAYKAIQASFKTFNTYFK